MVDSLYTLKNTGVIAIITSGFHQGLHIFGKTAPTIAASSIKKAITNATVTAHTHTNMVNVGTHTLTDICHLIHKGNSGGKHGIGSILGHFRAADIHDDKAIPVTDKGSIQLTHHHFHLLVWDANDNTVGTHAVLNGTALLQKFRVGYDLEGIGDPPFVQLCLNDFGYLIGGSHRDGGLVHHDHIPHHVLTDLLCHCQHILQIGTAIFIHRCTYRNKAQGGLLKCLLNPGGKVKIVCSIVFFYQFRQSRLINGDDSLLQCVNFLLICVYTVNSVAHFGKTGASYQTDITGANDG